MSQAETTVPATDSPQHHLAAILDGHQPTTLLTLSLNPVPLAEQWCADHGVQHRHISKTDPMPDLAGLGRFDLVLVADQLEYMERHRGEELLGLLRNLHTDSMVVTYRPELAPATLRWQRNDFIGMGLRRDAVFEQGERSMMLYSYELDTYNFRRNWNNPRFWANPENWGKYWW
ncbi:MAG: hypothetical protein C0462_11425 [Alcanivorax sp.]|nr:hypothetical protein [Alcanivorax sp.]